VPADGIGHSKQSFPTIGVPISYLARHVRHSDPVGSGTGPGSEPAIQPLAFLGMIAAAIGNYMFVRGSPLHPYHDRTAEHRVGQCSEAGQRYWRKSGQLLWDRNRALHEAAANNSAASVASVQ
jgi:hypothetical protein